MKVDLKEDYIIDSFKLIEGYDPQKIQASLILADPLEGQDHLFSVNGISENMTILSKGTVVDGNMESSSAVSISGKINGNVKTSSDIGVAGIVQGDISSRNTSLNHAGVRGNICATEDVSIDNSSVVVGNVNARNVVVNSKVKGDIIALGKVSFRKDTLAVGNITAGLINMEDGAKISGAVTLTTQSYKPEDFDQEFKMEDIK